MKKKNNTNNRVVDIARFLSGRRDGVMHNQKNEISS